MKFLTFEKTEKPICEIKDNKKFKKSKIIYLDSDNETNYKFNHFAIQEGYLQLLPNQNTERQILYIAGASGSGKTFFTGQYLKTYKETFPDNPIYMFSTIPKGDVSLKDVEIDYIDLETILEEDLTAKDFENSMVLFDDCDCITNKKIKDRVISIQASVLETGRHYRVSCIITNHEAYAGITTKKILNECHSITIFPLTLGGRALKYLLENYMGLDKDEIKQIKKLKTRAVTFIKSYPKIVLSNRNIYVLGSSDSGSDSESEIDEYIEKSRLSKRGKKSRKKETK